MAGRTFCTIEDLRAKEPEIDRLTPDSGHFNDQLTDARIEIEDLLIINQVIDDLDKLGANIKPRQLRLPAVYLSLATIYRANMKDDDSPYSVKAEKYQELFENTFSKIHVLDLDTDEDGVLEDTEQNARRVFTKPMRRR